MATGSEHNSPTTAVGRPPVIHEGLPTQLPDIDPEETQDWLDSFDAMVGDRGRSRARYLMLRLLERAREQNVGVPALRSTDYINTIPPEREPFARFPLEIEGWSGTPGILPPGIAQILAADDYLAAVYRDPAEAAPVDLFLSWYASQTAGAAIHSPAVCLPGAGWEVSAIEPVAVALPGTAAGTVRLNRAVIQKGLDRQLVYYWFEGRGRRLTNDFAAKFHTLADSLTRGRTDGGLVRLITPIGAGGEAAAEARLRAFLAATVDTLPRFLPE